MKSAEQMAERAVKLAGESAPVGQKIEALYSIALLRKPTDAEIVACEDHLKKQHDLFTRANLNPGEADRKSLRYAQPGAAEFQRVSLHRLIRRA